MTVLFACSPVMSSTNDGASTTLSGSMYSITKFRINRSTTDCGTEIVVVEDTLLCISLGFLLILAMSASADLRLRAALTDSNDDECLRCYKPQKGLCINVVQRTLTTITQELKLDFV